MNFRFLCLNLFAGAVLTAVNLNAQEGLTPTFIEAESADYGSNFQTGEADGVQYLAAIETSGGDYPTTAENVATFSVTFPSAGDYELLLRVLVGPGGGADDSLILANDFGDATVGSSADWSSMNNLGYVGFADPDEFILTSGNAGLQQWKWIRVSIFSEIGYFTVPEGALTQTYKIASRENGFLVDKLAFVPMHVAFTVNQLENDLPGTDYRNPESTEEYFPTGPIIAEGKTKFLGSVWSGTSAYNKDFEYYWNGMWHGNAGKWGSVEATRDNMNWTVVDEGYNFAKAHDVKFNFHILIWGAQQPSWIDNLSVEDKLDEIREWMQAVADRYPDIDYLQVVNEPLHAPPDGVGDHGDYMDALGGTGESGFDWILESFRMAREIFPDTPLMINEYSIEGDPGLMDEYIDIIQALQAEGLIDLVGLQGHAFSTQSAPTQVLKDNLDKLADQTGLPILVTEMEIDGHDNFVQLAEYQRVFPIYWDHPNVIGIDLSGHIGNWRYDQGAYLVDEYFHERPALQWIREYVQNSGWTSYDGYLESKGLDPATADFASDADQDGIPLGMEYLFDMDPSQADVYDKPVYGVVEGDFSYALDLPLNAGEGLVEVLTSTDLQNWEVGASYDLANREGDASVIQILDDHIHVVMEKPIDAGKRIFYKLRYTLK